MKLIFICGSLEPGGDGVGDYTRRLAGELIQQGHEIFLISIYDKYLKGIKEEQQKQEETNIWVLRLGTREKEKFRFQATYKAINQFNPDWISLQFVPYSFNNLGLPWTFGKKLKKLGNNWKWHIMFHELWVDTTNTDSLKLKLLGFCQKLIIKKMLLQLSPVVISTTLPLYRARLRNFEVNLLLLFGNISIEPGVKHVHSNNVLTAVHFGSFTGKIKDFKDQLKWLKQHGVFRRKPVQLLIMGGGGAFKKSAFAYANDILGKSAVKDLGRLNSTEISLEFLKADIGISRADQQYFRKSGSTISMLEHGLPVLLRGERNTADFSEDMEYGNLLYINDDPKKEYKRVAPFSNLKATAKKFLSDLQSGTGGSNFQVQETAAAFHSTKS